MEGYGVIIFSSPWQACLLYEVAAHSSVQRLLLQIVWQGQTINSNDWVKWLPLWQIPGHFINEERLF